MKFYDYLIQCHYGRHMLDRIKTIVKTVLIGYVVAIVFGLAPVMTSIASLIECLKITSSAIALACVISETIALVQKRGAFKARLGKRFF